MDAGVIKEKNDKDNASLLLIHTQAALHQMDLLKYYNSNNFSIYCQTVWKIYLLAPPIDDTKKLFVCSPLHKHHSCKHFFVQMFALSEICHAHHHLLSLKPSLLVDTTSLRLFVPGAGCYLLQSTNKQTKDKKSKRLHFRNTSAQSKILLRQSWKDKLSFTEIKWMKP